MVNSDSAVDLQRAQASVEDLTSSVHCSATLVVGREESRIQRCNTMDSQCAVPSALQLQGGASSTEVL